MHDDLRHRSPSIVGMLAPRFFRKLAGKPEARIFLYGLDAAGKTSILHQFKNEPDTPLLPTPKIKVETVVSKEIDYTVWDLGGHDTVQPLWSFHWEGAHALIFVVDSSDLQRIEEAAIELALILNDPSMKDVVLLVFANKQDVPGALSAWDVSQRLRLHEVLERRHLVQASSARTGDGIQAGFGWLAHSLADTGVLHQRAGCRRCL